MWRGLSYRLRLPLSLVATALFTALVIGVVMAGHTYQNVRIELTENGVRLGHALASAVQPALLHDDVWLAYSVLRGPRARHGGLDATLVVLDEAQRIFASNRPDVFPVARVLAEADPALAAALGVRGFPPEDDLVELDRLPDRLLLVAPISSDGVAVGAVLLIYPRQALWPRFASIVRQGGLSVLLVLAVIAPLGWLWGHRMVTPMIRLAACMERMREETPAQVECHIEEGEDEIGRLNTRFRELLTALREKAELERRMVNSERLAAVGRLVAGVAHEINNPLGGMLVAIDTLRQRGSADPHTERTLSLLERGLIQIRDTVSALLVEARRESHPLAAQDIEDTRTLVISQADKRGVRLAWDNRLTEPLPLPSTLVRQVVINLLLNAVQWAPRGGQVRALFEPGPRGLAVTLANDGEAIPAEVLDHLFEPYYSARDGGNGLGLWVTYQIVSQLGGTIEVESRSGETRFRVRLPVHRPEDGRRAA